MEPMSPAWQEDSLPLSHLGIPCVERHCPKKKKETQLICDENVICLSCPIWQPLAICEYYVLELRLV